MAGSEGRRKERLDRGIKVRAESIYGVSAWPEMLYLIAPRLLLIAGLLVLPLVFFRNPYWQRVTAMACLYGLLALGFDFLAHFVGLVSLGGAFFVGVGGYLAALLNSHLGLPPIITVPAAALLGGLGCTLVFLPCLPLRGVYFAIVSLMFPLLAARIIEALNILGGTDGIMGLDGLGGRWMEQYLPVGGALAAVFGLRRLVTEDVGLVLRGIKDNDQSVRASGINVTTYKALAVFIAASLGCLAGAILVHLYMWAGISLFALDLSILPIAATVIGGGGSLAGPLLGCLILVPVSELLRDFGTLRIAVYAVILTAFIVFKSEGLMSYAARKYHQFQRWVKI
jgi:branched-chain amino acid transport system permease protein